MTFSYFSLRSVGPCYFPSPCNIFQPLLWGCINNISLRIFIFHVDILYFFYYRKVFPLFISHLIVKFILEFICPLRPICEVINMQNIAIFYILLSKCSRTFSTPLFFAMRPHFAFLALSPVKFYFPTCWNSMKMILKVSLNLALVYFDRFQQTLDKTTLFYIAKNNQFSRLKQKTSSISEI